MYMKLRKSCAFYEFTIILSCTNEVMMLLHYLWLCVLYMGSVIFYLLFFVCSIAANHSVVWGAMWKLWSFSLFVCLVFFWMIHTSCTHIVPIPPDAFVSGVMLLSFALIDVLYTLHNTVVCCKTKLCSYNWSKMSTFFTVLFCCLYQLPLLKLLHLVRA